jgi:hypothetical protein
MHGMILHHQEEAQEAMRKERASEIQQFDRVENGLLPESATAATAASATTPQDLVGHTLHNCCMDWCANVVYRD